MLNSELRENTRLFDKHFPINVFHNRSNAYRILRLHWHEHFEWIMVMKGNAIFHIGGSQFPVGPGDILLVNSGELHTAFSEDLLPVEYCCIVFHPSLLGNPNADRYMIDDLLPYTSGQRSFVNMVEKVNEHYPDIQAAFIAIVDEFHIKQHGYQFAVKAYCQLIFTWLSRWLSLDGMDDRQLVYSRTHASRFKELLLYIDNHYMEKLTVAQGAAIVSLSPYYFCKMFKKFTGITFIQYVNLCRVNEAENMLRRTTLSVTVIAEAVGCGNINNFEKVFKKQRGYSPSQYRK